jgi:hypothetical protein
MEGQLLALHRRGDSLTHFSAIDAVAFCPVNIASLLLCSSTGLLKSPVDRFAQSGPAIAVFLLHYSQQKAREKFPGFVKKCSSPSRFTFS